MAVALAIAGSADLLVKRVVAARVDPGERLTVIPGLVALTFVRNERGAMGLFGARPALLIALALAVIVALAVLLSRSLRRSTVTQVGFGLVVGGALGNVVDRLAHGYVIDYIAFAHFYVFNLADACISCGLLLIALPALQSKASP